MFSHLAIPCALTHQRTHSLIYPSPPPSHPLPPQAVAPGLLSPRYRVHGACVRRPLDPQSHLLAAISVAHLAAICQTIRQILNGACTTRAYVRSIGIGIWRLLLHVIDLPDICANMLFYSYCNFYSNIIIICIINHHNPTLNVVCQNFESTLTHTTERELLIEMMLVLFVPKNH